MTAGALAANASAQSPTLAGEVFNCGTQVYGICDTGQMSFSNVSCSPGSPGSFSFQTQGNAIGP